MRVHSKKRIFGLDVLRAAAITMVVCSHILWIYPKSNDFIPTLFELFGFWGVELFFVLSGFLIGSILYKTFVEETYSLQEVRVFLKRRWFRTLPNYYLILCVNILIAFFMGYKIEGLHQYFYFAQNFSSKSPSFFPESWSLSIEEFAYLLLPFSLWGISRISKSNKSRLFLIVNLVWILFFIINKWIYNLHHINSDLTEWNLNLKSVLIYRVDAILIGVIAAWFSINYPSWWKNNKIVFAFFALMIFAFLMFGILPMNLTIEHNPFFWSVIYLPLTSIGFAFLLPVFSEWKSNTSIFKLPIEGVSKISYSIYLIHYSIVLQLVKYFFDTLQMSQLERHFVALATVLVTIIFSYILYKVFEKPIMNLRDK